MSTPIQFGEFAKNAESTRLIKLEWFEVIARYWERGRQYGADSYVRPVRPTGFSYRSTGQGQSGHCEPHWPRARGESVKDGDLTWVAEPAGANGIDAISAPQLTLAPAGSLTTGAPSIADGDATGSRVEIVLNSDGIPGTKYQGRLTVASAGQLLIGLFTVDVR